MLYQENIINQSIPKKPMQPDREIREKENQEIRKNLNHLSTLISILIVLAVVAIGLFLLQFKEKHAAFTSSGDIPCEGNQVEIDWCLLDLALNQREDYCENVFDSNIRKYCQAAINYDPRYCVDITNTEIQDACYTHLAKEKNDKLLCDSTSRPEYCKDLL